MAMDLETWKRLSVTMNKQKNDPHLRAVLPRKFAGCLMGFGGQTAKHLQQSLNIFLQLHQVENARWGRILSIKGSPLQQGEAWYECAILLLQGYFEYYEQFGFAIDFIFPTELIDLFVLQSDFQRISTKSHTKITVKHNYLMRSTERVVRVQTKDLTAPSIKGFQKAVYMICQLVEENMRLSLCSSGNAFYVEHVDDHIQRYINSNTESDLVFYPEVQERKIQSCSLDVEDFSKTVDQLDEDEIEQHSNGSEFRRRESGNSSYYDAVNDKDVNLTDFEEASEHSGESVASDFDQALEKKLCPHKDANSAHSNEVEKESDESNTNDAQDGHEKELCKGEINDNKSNKEVLANEALAVADSEEYVVMTKKQNIGNETHTNITSAQVDDVLDNFEDAEDRSSVEDTEEGEPSEQITLKNEDPGEITEDEAVIEKVADDIVSDVKSEHSSSQPVNENQQSTPQSSVTDSDITKRNDCPTNENPDLDSEKQDLEKDDH